MSTQCDSASPEPFSTKAPDGAGAFVRWCYGRTWMFPPLIASCADEVPIL